MQVLLLQFALVNLQKLQFVLFRSLSVENVDISDLHRTCKCVKWFVFVWCCVVQAGRSEVVDSKWHHCTNAASLQRQPPVINNSLPFTSLQWLVLEFVFCILLLWSSRIVLFSSIFTLRTSCGTVYCSWSCVFVGVCLCVCGSVTMITRNCVHRSSPNWICR